jgi:multicomponent Na+:H+ antiporter subunit G
MVVILFLLVGTFFFTTGTIGLLRFPDFYTRMHATGKCDTLGALLSLIGLALFILYDHFSLMGFLTSIKLIFIAVFILLANPTATHAIARAAHDIGMKPWTND